MSQMSFGLIDSKKHVMVVYDNIVIGHKIEFEFIKEGLDKKELSVYLTHGDVKQIEKEMQSFGIDVNYYKKKGLLKVGYVGNPAEESLGFMDAVQEKIRTILPDPEAPFRIVGRAIPDVRTEIAMAIQSRWEKILHTTVFDKLNGSILCTYDLSHIQANNEWARWLDELKENHHAYIICQNGKCNLVTNY
jgi:MEDS: MEthanogen/methylotroph, DcmR Sensory domain